MARYGASRNVAVLPFQGCPWLYGFRTKADAADSTLLGHINIDGANNPAGTVLFGVNNIQPAKASKFKEATNSTESSFVAVGAVTAARAAGWVINSGKRTSPRPSTRTKLVKVKIATGVFIAWPMPKETYDRLGAALATNGIVDVAAGDNNVAYGTNSITLTSGISLSRKKLKGRVQYGTAAAPKFATTYVAYDLTP